MADGMTSSVPQGAIMAVGASQPVVVATADGMFGVKKQMQVSDTCQNKERLSHSTYKQSQLRVKSPEETVRGPLYLQWWCFQVRSTFFWRHHHSENHP
jgi:hypothetical protein